MQKEPSTPVFYYINQQIEMALPSKLIGIVNYDPSQIKAFMVVILRYNM